MYIVRFVRVDGQSDEEYYYQSVEDANIHFDLFREDDSGLYKNIVILKLCENQEIPLAKLRLND